MGLPTDPRHSWSFAVVQSAIALAGREPALPAAPAAVAGVCDDLLKLFGSVPDGRSGRGRDHPVAAVLALAAAAVVAGMKGYTAIAGWVRDVPAPVLADLYLRAGACPAPPPSKATIWRVVTDADAEVSGATVGKWLMSGLLADPSGQGKFAGADGDEPAGLMAVRLDGKTVRGAKDAEGNQRHLLAALAGRTAASSVVAAQAEVGVKTNEVPMATVVLGQIDLNGKLVTADALHTVKATAEFIRERGGEFVLPVKENRKTLFDALDALPGIRCRSRTQPLTAGMAGSPPAPSRCCPRRRICHFRTSARSCSSKDTSVTWPATTSRRWPRLAWPAPPRTGPVPPTWPATCASNGRLSLCTGCVTLFTRKTNRRSEPGLVPG